MKKIIWLFIPILITILFSSTGYTKNIQSFKMGLVNPVYIYESVPQGEAEFKKLEIETKNKEESLHKEENNLIERIKDFQLNYANFSKEELEQKKALLIEDEEYFKEKAMLFKDNQIVKEQEITQNFELLFNKIVQNIAEYQGYDFILSLQTVPYVSSNLEKIDISPLVIEKMNESAEKTSINHDK